VKINSSTLLKPLGNGFLPTCAAACFGAVVAVRNTAYNKLPFLSLSTGKPTISIGGIHAGGTGKTPMTMFVGSYCISRHRTPVILSRGYRRANTNPVISPPGTIDSWNDVGDEPAMMHAALPQSWLCVGANRLANIRTVAPQLPENALYLLDDAFQHRRVRRDLDIVCLPSTVCTDTMLPAGTLREPMKNLARAQVLCLIGSPGERPLLDGARKRLQQRFPDTPVCILLQTPTAWVLQSTGLRRSSPQTDMPLAVCGIARPERFTALLDATGVAPLETAIFPDHHAFTPEEIEPLLQASGATAIVTTEKDAVRLKNLTLAGNPDIWYLSIELRCADEASEHTLHTALDTVIGLTTNR
jgi:tetraacyldisaccharide 4'-kinase